MTVKATQNFARQLSKLSVLTESVVLVKMMLRAGGNRTARYSLDYAINIGDFELVELLLDIGAPLSPYAVQLAMHRDHVKISWGSTQGATRILRHKGWFWLKL